MVDIPLPVADHDKSTVTFAVTFQWRKPWAMDHCELYGLCRTIKRLLRDGLIAEEYNHQLAAILAVETWEPREERHIGSDRGLGVGPIVLPTPPGYNSCILTGSDGENADDCTTHDHEEV